MTQQTKSSSAYIILQGLLGLIMLEGVAAFLVYFQTPSEAQSAIWGGFSLQRLAIGGLLFFILAGFIALLTISFTSRERFQGLGRRLAEAFAPYALRTAVLLAVSTVLVVNVFLLLAYLFPIVLQAVPFVVINPDLIERTGLMQLWAALICLKFLIFYFVFLRSRYAGEEPALPIKVTIAAWNLTGIIVVLTLLWVVSARNVSSHVVIEWIAKFVLFSLWVSIWWVVAKRWDGWANRHTTFLLGVTVWLAAFLLSVQVAQWMGSLITPTKNHWNLLANAFLHGRTFLAKPPSTYDLTLYRGHWYVPSPPLPAFVLLPLIAIWGVPAVNTTVVSLIIFAANAVFIFLILEELGKLGWIELSRGGRLWLVALLSFGTVALWLSISSQMWWFSQICTVFFIALAFLCALRNYSPWLAGACLAAAVLGRPNVFTLWPALVGIAIQLQISRQGSFSWKRLLVWATASGLPIVLAAGLLLYYNFLRFGSFSDFGYVTINGADWIVGRAQQTGIFNIVYFPENIRYILLATPVLIAKCGYYLPRGFGMSMFATTPAFLYLFRRFKFSWWYAGCWVSVILSVLLLAMYHNNGAVQYGFRYVMDFAVPMVMILAFNAGAKVSLPFKALIILSIAINYYGVVSWFDGPC